MFKSGYQSFSFIKEIGVKVKCSLFKHIIMHQCVRIPTMHYKTSFIYTQGKLAFVNH